MQRCGSCKQLKPLGDYSPSYRGKVGMWCRACHAAYARGERKSVAHIPLVCSWCNKTYVPTQVKKKNLFCSPSCKVTARNERLRLERMNSKSLRNCPWCGRDLPKEMRSDAVFCSERCNSSAHNSTRKMWVRLGIAKVDIAIISRLTLAKRDGLVCGICGDTVNLELDYWNPDTGWPDPEYVSIDHIVPLSKGGTNDLSNLQLAHLVCNVRKRNGES